jgi:histidinol phosphatase-like enzyme (inositol monophosphatase family)
MSMHTTHTPDTVLQPALDARLAVARRCALAAGELILSYYRRPALDVVAKGDGSPVTIADREAEQLMRRMIRDAFGNDRVVGEEFGVTEGSSGFEWVLDPIDGTQSFVHGVPLFGTMVGVLHEGRGVAGVIHHAALGEGVYAHSGGGTWGYRTRADAPGEQADESVRTSVSRTTRLGDAMVTTTSTGQFTKASMWPAWERINVSSRHTRGWSDCYGFTLVATGRADAIVEPIMALWDSAAAQAIIEEAGGVLTDFSGKPTVHAPTCVASNGLVHEELLRVIRG